MAYLRYYDPRYGDLYEVYFDDVTGEFDCAMRSPSGMIGYDSITYYLLSDLPPTHRDQIETLIWKQMHPRPLSSHES